VIEDKGTFIYRCRNCKKKFSPVSYPDAMGAAIQAVKNVDGFNMNSVHRCLNGDIGIADLIAISTTDKEKHKRLARMG
jgi:hypothetical protein